jgi:hypothetical protein
VAAVIALLIPRRAPLAVAAPATDMARNVVAGPVRTSDPRVL